MGKALIFLAQLVGCLVLGILAIVLILLISSLVITLLSDFFGLIAEVINEWRNGGKE